MSASIILQAPVRGEWTIMNPPGHPRLAFDFLAVDDGNSPYKGTSLLRHVCSTIVVEQTHAWGMPVYAVLPGIVVAACDGAADRLRLSMPKDLLRLVLFGPKAAPPFSNLGGNFVILECEGVYPLYAHLQNGSIVIHPGQVVRTGDMLGTVGN